MSLTMRSAVEYVIKDDAALADSFLHIHPDAYLPREPGRVRSVCLLTRLQAVACSTGTDPGPLTSETLEDVLRSLPSA